MRCLSLADAAQAHGHVSVFFCRELAGNLISEVKSRGYEVRVLPAPEGNRDLKPFPPKHLLWLEVRLADEIQQFGQALHGTGEKWDWVIVDHYALEAEWEKPLRSSGIKVLVIDDLADRAHFCDILVDQSFFPDAHVRYTGLVSSEVVCLFGPRFSLLRKEFADLRSSATERTQVREVLVSFGSSDHTGGAKKALDAILSISNREFRVRVILGQNEPGQSELLRNYAGLKGAEITGPATDFAKLLSAADLFVGAGGTTTWERFCLGLPGIVVAVAENQEPVSVALGEAGLIQYLGPSRQVTSEQIQKAILSFVQEPHRLANLSRSNLAMVDGLGAERVARWLEIFPLRYRRANESDARLLWIWANDPERRKSAFNGAEIPWESHQSWFQAKLASPRCQIFLAEGANHESLGQIRFDLTEEGFSEIDVSVSPAFRSLGVASRLIAGGVKITDLSNQFVAWVKPSNTASQAAFLAAGFRGAKLAHTSGELAWKLEFRKDGQAL